jgi:hypothetical protein
MYAARPANYNPLSSDPRGQGAAMPVGQQHPRPPAAAGPTRAGHLHGPAHAVAAGALGGLDLPLDAGGLVVGQDRDGQPVVVRVFRPRPTRVGAFGNVHVVMLLAFRALALGAQVVVVSPRPAVWAALAQAAPPGPAWVSPTPPAGSVLRPSLLVEDTGVGQGRVRHDLGTWQCAITVEPSVTDAVEPTLAACDLVLVQRAAVQAARPLRDTLSLPPDALRWLPQMPDDVLAVAAPGQLRFVRVVPTQVELTTFGPLPGHGDQRR